MNRFIVDNIASYSLVLVVYQVGLSTIYSFRPYPLVVHVSVLEEREATNIVFIK